MKRGALRDLDKKSCVSSVVARGTDVQRWAATYQLIRITRPLVDIIGNIEGRDANLADCMLELIWAHREVNRRLAYEEGDDIGFLSHTRRTLNDQFHAMNTDLHWFALFLHPLCRRLAVSSASHSRNITAAVSIALGIAYKWRWTKTQTQKLITDIKNYGIVKDSFGGAKADGKAWWEELVVDAREHPLKTMAVRILTIVPHAADVERLFSSLGGIQSVRRSQLTIPHMETLGALRNYYNAELHDLTVKMGKQTRRRHTHMHTRDEPGVNAARAQELLASFVWTGPLTATPDHLEDILAGPEGITDDDIEREFALLESAVTVEAGSDGGDGLSPAVGLEEVYNLDELDAVRMGVAPPTHSEEHIMHTDPSEEQTTWTPESLLAEMDH
ncbi:hypothetical protein PUNSTDRAFT_59810 [Punctularia strigosozonata HHB-11173 SS5]|uniref:uncharacterized protein n=1 Tax=Punctularia strigosozonata (strain HHB-11173) TaxID=741275 RepID=UPI0004416A71|nr:uncharacterized protein PUNSTDRAFT_59810 [Punctularia strigosozonata HHB-11173 SS5]EIN13163.1 hypothetical protein PUNSTDRAFT_59810 [Punctularia strigosozonata HHB-11173 SS5]